MPHLPDPQAGAQVSVSAGANGALAELLAGSGGHYERQINAIAHAASGDGAAAVFFFDGEHHGVAGDLLALLARARAAGHPAAEDVADLLRQLGAEVPEPEPAAEPAPAAARPPLPPAPPPS